MTENEALYHLPETGDVRVLVTGSREWDDYDTMYDALSRVYTSLKPRNPILVHGAARGADTAAETIWRRLGGKTEAHPADWTQFGKGAGHIRNAEMVKLGAVLCLAFLSGDSRGTRACMKLACKAGIPVVEFKPTEA